MIRKNVPPTFLIFPQISREQRTDCLIGFHKALSTLSNHPELRGDCSTVGTFCNFWQGFCKADTWGSTFITRAYRKAVTAPTPSLPFLEQRWDRLEPDSQQGDDYNILAAGWHGSSSSQTLPLSQVLFNTERVKQVNRKNRIIKLSVFFFLRSPKMSEKKRPAQSLPAPSVPWASTGWLSHC